MEGPKGTSTKAELETQEKAEGLFQTIEFQLQSLFDDWIVAAEWELTSGRLALVQLANDTERRLIEDLTGNTFLESFHADEIIDFVNLIVAEFSELLRQPHYRIQIIMDNEVVMKKITQQLIRNGTNMINRRNQLVEGRS